jgi:hypothetical protein
MRIASHHLKVTIEFIKKPMRHAGGNDHHISLLDSRSTFDGFDSPPKPGSISPNLAMGLKDIRSRLRKGDYLHSFAWPENTHKTS